LFPICGLGSGEEKNQRLLDFGKLFSWSKRKEKRRWSIKQKTGLQAGQRVVWHVMIIFKVAGCLQVSQKQEEEKEKVFIGPFATMCIILQPIFSSRFKNKKVSE
jgi:hypothetical protein